MDSNTLQVAARRAIEEYQPPTDIKTLGVPISIEKVRQELDALKQALVTPYLTKIEIPADEARLAPGSGPYWIVARDGDDVVYYDEGTENFGLAQVGRDGSLASINVRGDLPGVFMSR